MERVEGKTAYFVDGSSKDVDAIILCTGYKYHFPFLPDELRLETDNRLWPLSPYKGIFWENTPKMMYTGMQDELYTFNMFDAQAWYACDVILNRITLLYSKPEMVEDSLTWRKLEDTLESQEQEIDFQGDYVKALIADTDYANFDIDGVNKTFFEWEQNKVDDIMGFRNKTHCSLLTGTIRDCLSK